MAIDKRGAKKPSESKIAIAEQLVNYIDTFPDFIVTSYQGLTAREMVQMRKELRSVGSVYVVAKNTFFRIALHNKKNTSLDGYLFGATGIAFSKDDILGVARVVKKFQEKSSKLTIHGGYIDECHVDESSLRSLAALSSKEALYSGLMGSMNAPAQKIVYLFNESIASLARCLDAYVSKQQEN